MRSGPSPVAAIAFVLYAACSFRDDAGRSDFCYLADAFHHGRYWQDRPFGPWDNVIVNGRVYVPFGQFAAIAWCVPHGMAPVAGGRDVSRAPARSWGELRMAPSP